MEELNQPSVRLVPCDRGLYQENARRWFADPKVLRFWESPWLALVLCDPDAIARTEREGLAKHWAILDKNGMHIGFTGLEHIDMEKAVGQAYLVIGEPTYWNAGYAREVALAGLWRAFSVRELKVVQSVCHRHNIAARKLHEGLGFRLERADQSVHYVITREEFLLRYSAPSDIEEKHLSSLITHEKGEKTNDRCGQRPQKRF